MKKETELKRLHMYNFFVIFTVESYLAEVKLFCSLVVFVMLFSALVKVWVQKSVLQFVVVQI